MIWNFIRFICVVLVMMLITHSFLYVSWIQFFNISSIKMKTVLIASLFFLTISFIIASILVHFFYNPLTRAYYTLAGLWYGLVLFLILASVMVWLVIGLVHILPLSHPENLSVFTAMCLYVLAVLFTGYNFYNTFNIKITRNSVPIRNLPPQWQGKTIAHLSDLHIGSYADESVLRKIINTVNNLEPDIIAITGDLFDGASGRHEVYIDALQQLHAKKGVFFISGNHEIYAGKKGPMNAVRKSGITILDNKVIDLDGLQLIGVGYPSFQKKTPLFDIKGDPVYDPNCPSILLFHTPTDIGELMENSRATHSNAYLAPGTKFNTAKNLGVSLQLSGHTHAGQFIPFTWLTKIIFNGYHYGLHKIDDFHIYVSAGTGTWGPPIRSGYASEIAVLTLR